VRKLRIKLGFNRTLVTVVVLTAVLVTSVLLNVPAGSVDVSIDTSGRLAVSTDLRLSVGPETAQANPGWLTGYDYRQQITINGTVDGNQTDYQMMLLVDNATDTSSGNTCYVNGHIEADFDDIRFTTSDETTELDFWTENVNSGDNATV